MWGKWSFHQTICCLHFNKLYKNSTVQRNTHRSFAVDFSTVSTHDWQATGPPSRLLGKIGNNWKKLLINTNCFLFPLLVRAIMRKWRNRNSVAWDDIDRTANIMALLGGLHSLLVHNLYRFPVTMTGRPVLRSKKLSHIQHVRIINPQDRENIWIWLGTMWTSLLSGRNWELWAGLQIAINSGTIQFVEKK